MPTQNNAFGQKLYVVFRSPQQKYRKIFSRHGLLCNTVQRFADSRSTPAFRQAPFVAPDLSCLSAQSDKYMAEVNRLVGGKVHSVIAPRATRGTVATRLREIATDVRLY